MGETSGAKTCKSLLAVPDGYAIEISFESFNIADCSTGSVKLYNGKHDSATLMGTFCGSNTPTVLTSGDKNRYVVYTSTDASNSFKASWKKVTITCCSTVSVSTENSGIMGAYGSYLFGTFTYTPGDDINDRPIYRQSGGNAYFAVKTVPTGYLPGWVGSNTANT